jgi:hypothetical protein
MVIIVKAIVLQIMAKVSSIHSGLSGVEGCVYGDA